MATAVDRVSELPFLDLGDETRGLGQGKIFGHIDDVVMLDGTELPITLPFPFGNGTETKIYVGKFI